jgi:hypothetical protein
MKLLKRSLLLLALFLVVAVGKTQVQAKEISSYSGTTVKVSKSEKSVNVYAKTSKLKVVAPGATYVAIYQGNGKNCKSVDLSGCTAAKEVVLYLENMTSFKLPKNGGNIKELRICTGQKKLVMPTVKKATYLSVFYSDNLTTLDLKNVPSLKTLLILGTPKLSSLNISQNKKLTKLIGSDTGLKTVDTSKNTNLKLISLADNTKLTSLDCSNNTKLTALQCYSNKLTSLKVGKKNTSLKEINCENNKLKTLDLSATSKIKKVTCYNNPLKTLKVKSQKNSIKAVTKTAKFSSVTTAEVTAEGGWDYTALVIKMKKNSKIKDYVVTYNMSDFGDNWYEGKKKSNQTYQVGYVNSGEKYKLKAVSGVSCNGATVYYKATAYGKTVTVE